MRTFSKFAWMCNRVATPREDEIQGYFDKMDTNLSHLFKVNPYEHFYHITAFTRPLIPFVGADDPLKISPAMWKFMPANSSMEIYKEFDTCNAKAEKIFETKTYRDSILERRGLVVLKGFYEGQEQLDKTSQPYFIYPANGEILTLGCVYSDWYDKAQDKVVRTFSIITTAANELMAKIHNKKKRMPLIIPAEKRMWWLSNLAKGELQDYFVPYPDGYLAAHPVTRNLYQRGYKSNTPEVQQIDNTFKMERTPFDNTNYKNLLSSKYHYAEIVATGKEIQTDEDVFKKELILRLYSERPMQDKYYIVELTDPELAELSHGTDTDVAFIEYMN